MGATSRATLAFFLYHQPRSARLRAVCARSGQPPEKEAPQAARAGAPAWGQETKAFRGRQVSFVQTCQRALRCQHLSLAVHMAPQHVQETRRAESGGTAWGSRGQEGAVRVSRPPGLSPGNGLSVETHLHQISVDTVYENVDSLSPSCNRTESEA